jgi:hypothetical protein
MPKFIVQIFGELPDCLEVEAADADAAEDEATEKVLELLSFEADPAEEAKPCPPAE